MDNRGPNLRQRIFVVVYLIVIELFFSAISLHAQVKATAPQNSNTSGLQLPNRIVPKHYPSNLGPPPSPPTRKEGRKEKEGLEKGLQDFFDDWSFTLSGTYDYFSQRSRLGGVTLDGQSFGIDIGFSSNNPPFPSFDASYIYTSAKGSSPTGTTQVITQHLGSVRLLQPLNLLWPFDRLWPFKQSCNEGWQPAALSFDWTNNPKSYKKCSNHQISVILGAEYGGDRVSTQVPRLPGSHSSANLFIGNALLDYQFAARSKSDDYADLFFEFSSGIQFSRAWLNSSDHANQLTYQNIASLNCSFLGRLGVLVAAEWDAPVHSDFQPRSPSSDANTAIFTAGLTYNYAPGKRGEKRFFKDPWCPHRWSFGLLYSYTAFDPTTETNQLQVQISWSF